MVFGFGGSFFGLVPVVFLVVGGVFGLWLVFRFGRVGKRRFGLWVRRGFNKFVGFVTFRDRRKRFKSWLKSKFPKFSLKHHSEKRVRKGLKRVLKGLKKLGVVGRFSKKFSLKKDKKIYNKLVELLADKKYDKASLELVVFFDVKLLEVLYFLYEMVLKLSEAVHYNNSVVEVVETLNSGVVDDEEKEKVVEFVMGEKTAMNGFKNFLNDLKSVVKVSLEEERNMLGVKEGGVLGMSASSDFINKFINKFNKEVNSFKNKLEEKRNKVSEELGKLGNSKKKNKLNKELNLLESVKSEIDKPVFNKNDLNNTLSALITFDNKVMNYNFQSVNNYFNVLGGWNFDPENVSSYNSVADSLSSVKKEFIIFLNGISPSFSGAFDKVDLFVVYLNRLNEFVKRLNSNKDLKKWLNSDKDLKKFFIFKVKTSDFFTRSFENHLGELIGFVNDLKIQKVTESGESGEGGGQSSGGGSVVNGGGGVGDEKNEKSVSVNSDSNTSPKTNNHPLDEDTNSSIEVSSELKKRD